MPPKTPTQKGGGKTPQGSSGKKKGRDGRGGNAEPEPPPAVFDAVLQISRSDLSGPEKLLMAPADMRRMAMRAGDWLVVRNKQVEEALSPYEGLVVLRVWPGPTVPPGTVAGGPPFVTGQFSRPQSGAELSVTVKSLASSALRVLHAASVVLRLPMGEPKQPPYRHAGSSVFFTERLKDLLNGAIIFPRLTLSLTVFGRTYRFEVTSIKEEEEEVTAPEATPAREDPQQSKEAQEEEEQEDFLAQRISALSIQGGKPSETDGSGLPVYTASQSTVITLMDGTDYGSRGLGGESGQQGTGEAEDPWRSVGGLDAQVSELRQGIELPLLAPDTFHKYGLRPPRGLLVTGPPGTGKSTVLRAAGREFRARGVHVMPLSGPELMGELVGETEANLKKVFEEAKARAPSLVLLDEAEVLCRKREAGASEVEKRVVSTFLALMDGYAQMDKVMVLAATSQPSALDPAVRRPGRFDREIELGVPGDEARAAILRVLLREAGVESTSSSHSEQLTDDAISSVASRAHGFVGADLLLLCKEAALEALATQGTKRGEEETVQGGAGGGALVIREADLVSALKRVRPSALREVTVEVPRVQWTDIGGQEAVKQALKESVEWPLTHPDAFLRMGISPPKGVLLYGPPGCSKTLMARALATESSMNFLAVKGPELLSKWLGESERALQSLFKKARAAAPTVIFFDEVDALAGRRGGDSRASERVLSQLLTELDGIQPLKRVVVIAATNRPDLIDPALLRPGRIGRMVYVPPPDAASRAEIVSIALRGVPTEGVDIDQVARMTEGFSGAEVVAVCREAALVAIGEDPENASCLRAEHFEQAIRTWKPQITAEMLSFYRRWAATHSDPL